MLSLISSDALAQGCFNSDFESGDVDGYTTYVGNIASDGTIRIDNQVLSPSQHRVHFVTEGNDPIAEEFCIENKELPMVPIGGGAYALRLGNSQNGAQAERVTISFTVTEENNFFLLNYAVLLNDPSHQPHQQPRFRLSITDSQGEQYACGYYEVVAAANIENFENCGRNWKVRPWTSIGIELQSYIGEEINIEMSTNDCSLGGHAGYAYLDATCKPLEIELFDNCDSNSVARMQVTTGFDEYLWSTGDTTSEIQIRDPKIGDEYFVTVTSATGCSIVLSDTIPPYTVQVQPQFGPSTTTTICSETAYWFKPEGINVDRVYSVELGIFVDSLIINNVTESSYTFIAYSRSGCPLDSVTHYFNGLPFVKDSIGKTSCIDDADGSISLRPLIEGLEFDYAWNTGDTTSYLTDLRTGTYRVTISSEYCDYVMDYVVEHPDPLSVEVDQDNVICRGYGAEAEFYVEGGTWPYFYSYDGGTSYSGSCSYASFKEGNNKIYIKDKNNCLDSVTIYFPLVELPEIISYDIFQDSCGNPGNQIRVNQSTSGLPPYEYNVDFSEPFSSATTFNDFPIGPHTLYVRDANECINRVEFEFKYYESFFITFLDIEKTSCTLSNGSVTIETSQTDLVQYAIDNLPYQQSSYFGPLESGQHVARTVNRNGCIQTRDFWVADSYLPVPINSVDNNLCNGFTTGEINLTEPDPANPYSYTWSTGDTVSSLSNLADGTYNLTVTDSEDCVNNFSYDIVSPSALEIDVNGVFFSCQDRNSGEIYIDAIGGVGNYTYSFDGGQSYRVDDFNTGVGPGQYTVQVKDGNSCITERVITIEQYLIYDDIQLGIDSDTCASAIGALSIENIINGAPPYQYSINGTNYQDVAIDSKNLTHGDYTLYIRDNNGCIWLDSFSIDSIFSINIETEVNNTICEENNGQLQVSSNSSYNNLYYLNDSLMGTDSLLTGLFPGSYKLLVENQYGCKDSAVLQLTEGLLPMPMEALTNNTCSDGREGSITLTNTSVSSTYSYQWSTGATGNSISNLPIGVYEVTVSDADNCENYLDFEIVAPPPLSIDITGIFYNCPDFDNGEINITASGGDGTLEYSIDGGANYGTETNYAGLKSGSYLVRMRDENLCTKDTLIEVADYVYAEDISLVVAMDTCVAANGALVVENRTKGVGPYRYSVNGTDFLPDTSFFDLSYGKYSLYIEDGNGCVWDQAFEIDTMFSLHINAVVLDTECDEANGQVAIAASSDFGNQYYLNDDYVGEDSIINSLSAQKYAIVVRNDYGCSDTVSVEVLPSKVPIIEMVDVDYLSCLSKNNYISADVSSGNPPFTYSMDDQPEQPMNAFNNLDTGMHMLKVIDTENCIAEMAFYIEGFEPIEVELDYEDPTCGQNNGSVMIDARGGTGPLTVVYDELIYAADEVIQGLYKGRHTFMVQDTTDCATTVSIDLDVQCKYYIPNIFSPDDDGFNDAFEIFFSEGTTVSITEFSVYDRWGSLVAQMLNINPDEEAISWDGNFNNQRALTGVYTYVLSGRFETGEEIQDQGTFTLVR